MSTSSPTQQSRERILDTFQNISGLNVEDCIQFLNQYNWKLEDIVDAFFNKKDFKTNSNERKEFQQPSIQNSHSENVSTKNTRQPQAINTDDHYIAELLAQYGDADESARRHYRENQQSHRSEQFHEQPKENTKNEPIVHEKQKLLRCGLHSLNNLFQIRNLFTPEHLDSIVREFDKRYVNNDYATTWVGDYDLRILIEAINRTGHPVRQINFRNGESLATLPWDDYFGLLLNINGAHWFTIKKINGFYYNLDSTFSKPSQIGYKNALINYLIHLIQRFNDFYIFAVSQQNNK